MYSNVVAHLCYGDFCHLVTTPTQYWSHLLSQFQLCKQFIIVYYSQNRLRVTTSINVCNICAQNFFNCKTKSFSFRFWQRHNNHIISNCNHRTTLFTNFHLYLNFSQTKWMAFATKQSGNYYIYYNGRLLLTAMLVRMMKKLTLIPLRIASFDW